MYHNYTDHDSVMFVEVEVCPHPMINDLSPSKPKPTSFRVYVQISVLLERIPTGSHPNRNVALIQHTNRVTNKTATSRADAPRNLDFVSLCLILVVCLRTLETCCIYGLSKQLLSLYGKTRKGNPVNRHAGRRVRKGGASEGTCVKRLVEHANN